MSGCDHNYQGTDMETAEKTAAGNHERREKLVSGGQQREEGEGPELGSCRLPRFERSLCISPVRDDYEPVLQIFPPFFKINCGDRQRWERSTCWTHRS